MWLLEVLLGSSACVSDLDLQPMEQDTGASGVLTFQPYGAPDGDLYVWNKGSNMFGPGGGVFRLGPGGCLNPLHERGEQRSLERGVGPCAASAWP